MKQAQRLLSVGCIGVLCACFAVWMQGDAFRADYSVLAAILAVVLFGIAVLAFIKKFVAECTFPTFCKKPVRRRFAFGKLILLFLFLRLATLAAGFLMHRFWGGGGSLIDVFFKGDAYHYMGLAENGYVNVGDARFHIVFFPLYPLLVRAFAFFTGSFPAAGICVSVFFAAAAGCAIYELALCDMDEPDAFFAALAVNCLPAAFFFSAPMSESVFLLFSVLCALFARKGNFILAGCFGFFAALSRAPGVSLILLLGICFLPYFFAAQKQDKKMAFRLFLQGLGGIGLVLGGFCLYLWLNFLVTGNALQYAVYQKEHWSQSFGWFFSTAAYQLRYAVGAWQQQKMSMLAIWVPGLISIFLGLCGLIFAAKRLPCAFSGWAIGYFAATIGATWLLSAPRYLSVLFPFALALACVKNKKLRFVWVFVLLLLQLCYFGLYVKGYPVY